LDADHVLRDSPISSLFQSVRAESGWGQRWTQHHRILRGEYHLVKPRRGTRSRCRSAPLCDRWRGPLPGTAAGTFRCGRCECRHLSPPPASARVCFFSNSLRPTSQPANAPGPRSSCRGISDDRERSSRNGGRNHPGTPSEIKSECWATSSRIRGRLPPESAHIPPDRVWVARFRCRVGLLRCPGIAV
jgi:hypothetical protein